MLSADTNVLLPDDFLTKVDRASMGSGLEVRPPFIDRSLMELAAGLPSRFKFRQQTGKWILKRLFAERLPAQHVHRRKQGFEIPIDAWLRGPLKEQVEEVVLRPDALISRFINTRFAERLYRSHCNSTGRHGQLIWSLLVLGRWMDRWQREAANISCPQSISPGTSPRTPAAETVQEVPV
jgi:asparagine synthase (glutamine-hydrolysing)